MFLQVLILLPDGENVLLGRHLGIKCRGEGVLGFLLMIEIVAFGRFDIFISNFCSFKNSRLKDSL